MLADQIAEMPFEDRDFAERVLTEALGGMTARQAEVLELCCSGMTQREAANQLGLDQRTVGRHFNWALDKIRVVAKRYA